jgi:four helix bundle protein
MLGVSTVSEQADQLQERTFRFALGVIELTKTLPTTEPGPTIRRQLTKAATSVGANYRAARRARSHAEFTAKIGVVAEEADETVY